MQSQFLIDCRDVNKKIKRIIGAVCLLVLFVAYQTSITAFTHVHYVNGVLITHSHPFHGKHTHSKSELVVIGRLSTFQSPEVDVYEELHPYADASGYAGSGKINILGKGRMGAGRFSSRSAGIRGIIFYQAFSLESYRLIYRKVLVGYSS